MLLTAENECPSDQRIAENSVEVSIHGDAEASTVLIESSATTLTLPIAAFQGLNSTLSRDAGHKRITSYVCIEDEDKSGRVQSR